MFSPKLHYNNRAIYNMMIYVKITNKGGQLRWSHVSLVLQHPTKTNAFGFCCSCIIWRARNILFWRKLYWILHIVLTEIRLSVKKKVFTFLFLPQYIRKHFPFFIPRVSCFILTWWNNQKYLIYSQLCKTHQLTIVTKVSGVWVIRR